MRQRIIQIALIFYFIIHNNIFSQSILVSGHVLDENNSPLIGANISIPGTLIGTVSDKTGSFSLSIVKLTSFRIKISMIGFEVYTSEIFSTASMPKDFVVNLKRTTYQSDQIVITANKVGQNLIDLPVSASIFTSDQLSKGNYLSLDQAAREIPGVNITLDQVSIRGSSGYSRGAGSRVLVAFDGVPIYTGDSGEIIWELIPLTEIERIEVIKGAASSLYGSSAIGGVINLIPKNTTSTPLTFIRTLYGVYDSPSHKDWEWSGKTRTFNGTTVTHSQKFGQLGTCFSIYRIENFSYRQNDYDRRLGGYIKLNYRFGNNTLLDLWTTGFTRKRESFNFWKNLKYALSPPDEDLNNSQPSNRQIAGLSLKHVVGDNLSLALKSSIHRTDWKDQSESRNKSVAMLYRNELNSTYSINSNIMLVSGLEVVNATTTSNIFGNRSLNSFGLFSQLEYEMERDIKLSLGVRYDNSQLTNLNSESAYSPKFGINYKLNNSIVLRGSIGTGFRAPTLAEAFTSTTTSGLSIKPNPNIVSERNFSSETGFNYMFSEDLNIDLAIFNNEYYDLIEPVLDPIDTKVIFKNITRARIQGTEVNIGSYFFDKSVNLNIGYTFIYPHDLEAGKDLKYRSRHQLISSINWDYENFTIGINFRYLSRIREINDELVDFGIVPDGDKRVDIKVLDLKIAANLFSYFLPIRVFLKCDNALNYNYVEMIGNIAPIRNYSFSLEMLL